MTASRKGQIKVQTGDIFPVIKKWLYSEHDIFLRELVSNGCDAITKRKTLSQSKNTTCPEGKIMVEIDSEAKTLSISDNGLGMTEAEVEKYITQLAFSGAEEFVKKLKEDNVDVKDSVIGKFGLGFYSAFMVASKVEINTLSMNEGAEPVKWLCTGETDYEYFPGDKKVVGTTITLTLNEESQEFLQSHKTRTTLKNYCDFMPYPIELIDLQNNKKNEEEKKPIDIDVINNTLPLWKKEASTLTDEDYIQFYQEMFPMESKPLFWLHLNIDHPFELKGILYFPKLNPQKPIQEQNIRLYCKQVFVSDNVKSVIPEFLSMLKGAIDSTDIPLNVSRSALQGDPNVKKISNYIVKKVAESLKKLFNTDRPKFETLWADIGLFVKYAALSEKFDELMRPFLLFKNADSKLITLNEYKEMIPSEFKEKIGNKVIFFEKNQSDESLRSQLWAQKIPVIETEALIDPHLTQHLEYKKVGDVEFKFASIDAEFEHLMSSDNLSANSTELKELLEKHFKEKTEQMDQWVKDLEVEIKPMASSPSAAYIKVDQNMKRFMQMSRSMGGGMETSFPVKKTLVVNDLHPLVKNAFDLWHQENKKPIAEKIVRHVVDLAKLSSEGMEGEQKDLFIKRSQDLMQELSGLIK
jgi:molecular chaperone HtpG